MRSLASPFSLSHLRGELGIARRYDQVLEGVRQVGQLLPGLGHLDAAFEPRSGHGQSLLRALVVAARMKGYLRAQPLSCNKPTFEPERQLSLEFCQLDPWQQTLSAPCPRV